MDVMQGKWKEKTPIYKKDNKRKRQKRKHTIKDKIKWYLSNKEKNLNKKNLHEDIYEHVEIKKIKKEIYLPVYILYLKHYIDKYDKYKIIKIKAFKWGRNWINIETIDYVNGFVFNSLKTDDFYQITLNNEKEVEYKLSEFGNDKLIMFNKLLPQNYWRFYRFYSSSKKKFWQKHAHKKDRMYFRNWVSNRGFYFDKEIKTHYLSKSIYWKIW